MRKAIPVLIALVIVAAFGCATTRSISDSGYRGGKHYNYFYRGELSEFDVIGLPAGTNITQQEIQGALASRAPIRLERGESLLVIQSGAMAPDEEFLRELNLAFQPAPFSGQPAEKMDGFSARIRLAAAQGGYRHLLCYWGVLEASQVDHVTKTLSWIPVAGGLLPDQSQAMRIRLKAILVDVASGRWEMILPEPVAEDRRLSAKFNRESSDQQQVERLKEAGYRALAQAIAAKAVQTAAFD